MQADAGVDVETPICPWRNCLAYGVRSLANFVLRFSDMSLVGEAH